MSHSWLPSRMVRFWLSIFWRADWSILASWVSKSSSIFRVSSRIVLRSSTKSTCGISASASLTTWAILFTLSRLSLTVPHERCGMKTRKQKDTTQTRALRVGALAPPGTVSSPKESFDLAVVAHFHEQPAFVGAELNRLIRLPLVGQRPVRLHVGSVVREIDLISDLDLQLVGDGFVVAHHHFEHVRERRGGDSLLDPQQDARLVGGSLHCQGGRQDKDKKSENQAPLCPAPHGNLLRALDFILAPKGKERRSPLPELILTGALRGRPCTSSPTRSSPCGTSPGSWRRSGASRRNTPPESRAPRR